MGFYPFVISSPPTGAAGGALAGTYPNPTLGSAALLAEPPWLPSDTTAVQAWTYDPAVASNSTPISGAGTINLIRVNVRSQISCTNVILAVIAAGATLTAAENFAGLYAGQTAGAFTAGQLIGTTADQSTNWVSAGVYVTALTGGPFTLPAGFYWVAAMCNGTTGPALARSANPSAGYANISVTAATGRYATNGTGITLPASITPASNVLTPVQYWAGLS